MGKFIKYSSEISRACDIVIIDDECIKNRFSKSLENYQVDLEKCNSYCSQNRDYIDIYCDELLEERLMQDKYIRLAVTRGMISFHRKNNMVV